MRTSTVAVGLLTAVLLVGGCGSDSEPRNEPVSQAGANDDVDAPNPGGDQPSATLPGLPIGGLVPDTALTTTDPSGCGTVAWVGPGEQIPEGIEVAITKFHLPDHVSVDASACAGAEPACLGGVTFWTGQTSCNLGVRWTGETPATLEIGADGTAYCDDQAACDQFKEELVTQTAVLVIEASESAEDGDSLVTPSVTDPPSDGTG
jgi:hypothetical protein